MSLRHLDHFLSDDFRKLQSVDQAEGDFKLGFYDDPFYHQRKYIFIKALHQVILLFKESDQFLRPGGLVIKSVVFEQLASLLFGFA
jgi:hypothetical protein